MTRLDVADGQIAEFVDGEVGCIVVDVQNQCQTLRKRVCLDVVIHHVHLIAVHVHGDAGRSMINTLRKANPDQLRRKVCRRNMRLTLHITEPRHTHIIVKIQLTLYGAESAG